MTRKWLTDAEGLSIELVPVLVEVVEFLGAVVELWSISVVLVESTAVDPVVEGDAGVKEDAEVVVADVFDTGVVESPQLSPYPERVWP
jgi:hypothetical protein